MSSHGLAQHDIEKRLDRFLAEQMEAARVRCPKCNHLCYDANAGFFEDPPVSYWGDDLHDVWCEECDHSFEVREQVSRTYEVVGGEGEAG